MRLTRPALGSNEVSFRVYKRCPNLLRQLWMLLKLIWRKGRGAKQWKYSERVWIPKEKKTPLTPKNSEYTPIKYKGQDFFSILSWRLPTFLLKNEDILIRSKRLNLGHPGGTEQSEGLTQRLKDTKGSKQELVGL